LQVKNPQLTHALLDGALESETLAAWYPGLQAAVKIEAKDLDRIRRSLALGKTLVGRYEVLAWGGAPNQIPAHDLKELVLTIAAKPDGFSPALEILRMRLYSDDQEKRDHAPEIIEAGHQLLRQFTFAKKTDREDYRVGTIVKSCLVGEEGAATAREICLKLKDSVSKHETYSFNHGDLLKSLLATQPAAVLDGLCCGEANEIKLGTRIIEDLGRFDKNLLDAVPEGDLLGWCDEEPDGRYVIAAAGISISLDPEWTRPRRWTNIALTLLEKAPDRVALLRQFVRQFRPRSWSGSRAAIVASYAKLLDELEGHSDLALTEFVAQEKVRLTKEIEVERRAETLQDRATDERFE